jgi:membrane-bound metal-dependent hydrolase YbcI (DUF457 family)
LLLGLLIWLNLLLCCIWLAGAGWFWRWDHNPTNLNLLHSSFILLWFLLIWACEYAVVSGIDWKIQGEG